MTKYKYHIRYIEHSELSKELNNFGERGWHVVSVTRFVADGYSSDKFTVILEETIEETEPVKTRKI